MTKAFLSHTSSDKDLVSIVQEKLTEKNSWYDAVNIEDGENIPEKINEGLRMATHYVLFWSKKASESPWVRAEMNAAFIRFLSSQCKFIIFTLDDTQLPPLLEPYKYEKIDKFPLKIAAEKIVNIILSEEGVISRLSDFVNRTAEVGQIEEFARKGYKLIILNGILGIGKTSLAEKSIEWLYSNKSSKRIIIDFSTIPGVPELILELSRKAKVEVPNYETGKETSAIRYLMELLSQKHVFLILKDIKDWLNDDGTLNENLKFFLDIIVTTNLFEGVTIATTSRFVELPGEYFKNTYQFHVNGMNDEHIATIIHNNLPKKITDYDEEKTKKIAAKLYGYPLAAKLGAYCIANHGYDYYLKQPQKIQSLKVSLAKELISYAEISPECEEYLKMVALVKSKLKNEEYIEAFPSIAQDIAKLCDEAYFAGVLKFDDDGCYKLEPIVEDYYYDLAFNSEKRDSLCMALEKYLMKAIQGNTLERQQRLLPIAVHVLTINGKYDEAHRIACTLISTMRKTMWDQYNQREYEDALRTAEYLLQQEADDFDALYVKSLSLIRLDKCSESQEILKYLLSENEVNSYKYYNALGRIEKIQCHYEKAIEFFEISCNIKENYLSPRREMAECYIYLNQLTKAKEIISKAKEIDDSNIYLLLLEAQLLQKMGKPEESIKILTAMVELKQDKSKILFRLGRAYDQLNDLEKAEECYNMALEKDPKMYEAKLCLLNHQIIDASDVAEREIKQMKNKLSGKRLAILTNIEARLIGFIKGKENEALSLLAQVRSQYQDKQWYAVKIQLLERLAEKNKNDDRIIIAAEQKKQIAQLKLAFEQKFKQPLDQEIDLLPDA